MSPARGRPPHAPVPRPAAGSRSAPASGVSPGPPHIFVTARLILVSCQYGGFTAASPSVRLGETTMIRTSIRHFAGWAYGVKPYRTKKIRQTPANTGGNVFAGRCGPDKFVIWAAQMI